MSKICFLSHMCDMLSLKLCYEFYLFTFDLTTLLGKMYWYKCLFPNFGGYHCYFSFQVDREGNEFPTDPT